MVYLKNHKIGITLFVFRFTQLDKEDKGHLSRDDLMAIPELAINPLAERIVDLFLPQHSQSLEATQCTFMKFCEVHFLFMGCFPASDSEAQRGFT